MEARERPSFECRQAKAHSAAAEEEHRSSVEAAGCRRSAEAAGRKRTERQAGRRHPAAAVHAQAAHTREEHRRKRRIVPLLEGRGQRSVRIYAVASKVSEGLSCHFRGEVHQKLVFRKLNLH